MIFLSYKSEEEATMLSVREKLTECGYICWSANLDIPGGSGFMEEIPKAIKEAGALVLMLSEKAQTSDVVKMELATALDYRTPIIAINIDGCALNEAYKFIFRMNQIIPGKDRMPQAMQELIRALESKGVLPNAAADAPVVAAEKQNLGKISDMPESAAKTRIPAPKPEIKSTAIPYSHPPIDLLKKGNGAIKYDFAADWKKSKQLIDELRQLDVKCSMGEITHGVSVTRFELKLGPGVKEYRLVSLQNYIAANLFVESVRVDVSNAPAGSVYVEIPNDVSETVHLRDVLESAEAKWSNSCIAVGLGKDIEGRGVMANFASLPNLLIGGQAGSGKSTCIHSIIASILYRATPDEVKLILIDLKRDAELSVYEGIPHLACPVVRDSKKAIDVLQWVFESRLDRFKEAGVRDIVSYNMQLKPGEKRMPQLVIIIDELIHLMMYDSAKTEDKIRHLAQLAYAAGIHLVIATQHTSANIVTGIIKANIPSRIALSVPSSSDSRAILDHSGAEKLLGNGDMLFSPIGGEPKRMQGAWISDAEVRAITEYLKARYQAAYDENLMKQLGNVI